MTNYLSGRILVLLTVMTCFFSASCKSNYHNVGLEKSNAVNNLRDICIFVNSVEYISKEPAPTSLTLLVTWLEKKILVKESFIDYEGKTIKDIWGNTIIIMSQQDRFIGVGSAGPNGKWEGGQGDDLTYLLSELIAEEENRE